MGRDLFLVDRRLRGVGRQDGDHVRPGGGVGTGDHGEPLGFGAAARAASGMERDPHLDPAVPKVQRVGVALRAVTEDRDLLATDQIEVRGVVVIDVGHGRNPPVGGGDVRPPGKSAPRAAVSAFRLETRQSATRPSRPMRPVGASEVCGRRDRS